MSHQWIKEKPTAPGLYEWRCKGHPGFVQEWDQTSFRSKFSCERCEWRLVILYGKSGPGGLI